jgi:hypothetical protein
MNNVRFLSPGCLVVFVVIPGAPRASPTALKANGCLVGGADIGWHNYDQRVLGVAEHVVGLAETVGRAQILHVEADRHRFQVVDNASRGRGAQGDGKYQHQERNPSKCFHVSLGCFLVIDGNYIGRSRTG